MAYPCLLDSAIADKNGVGKSIPGACYVGMEGKVTYGRFQRPITA